MWIFLKNFLRFLGKMKWGSGALTLTLVKYALKFPHQVNCGDLCMSVTVATCPNTRTEIESIKFILKSFKKTFYLTLDTINSTFIEMLSIKNKGTVFIDNLSIFLK